MALGLTSVLRLAQSGGGQALAAWVVAALMFANAAVLLWLGWGLRRQKKLFYYLTLIVLGVNILLTITDQFGVLDLLYLIMAAALFVFLLITRARYLGSR